MEKPGNIITFEKYLKKDKENLNYNVIS